MAVGLAADFLCDTLISAVLSFMEFFSLGSTPVMLRNLRHDLWNVVTAAPPSGFFYSQVAFLHILTGILVYKPVLKGRGI
ncbi:hypothetical protein QL093DRAFT_2356370 [Fusarium oxysporum]|nr:hypothetical protein QL093DRAFT_2356370 [Fusarium oxysporum]